MKKLNVKIYLMLLVSFLFIHHSYAQNLEWAISQGGINRNQIDDLEVDNDGNIITTGYFEGSGLFGSGSNSITLAGNNYDLFLAKYNEDGDLLWAISEGGENSDYENGKAIAVNDEFIFLGGYFTGNMEFGEGSDATTISTENEEYDFFIAKYNHEGVFISVLQQGGTNNQFINAMELDMDNNIIIHGNFTDQIEFGSGTSLQSFNSNGVNDFYLAKYNSDFEFVWATIVGGEDYDSSGGIAISEQGEIYLSATFIGDINIGGQSLSSFGYKDGLIAKFDIDGNMNWAMVAGGGSRDVCEDIAIDNNGDVYAVGSFDDNMTIGAGENIVTVYGTYYDMFIAKISSDGDVIWVRTGGGSGDDEAFSIDIDNNNNVFAVGYFTDEATFGFESTPIAITGEWEDCFITKYTSEGILLFADGTHSNERSNVTDCAVDNENIYITGGFEGALSFGDEPDQIIINGGNDDSQFIAKYKEVGVGLSQLNDISINVYPNPSNGVVYIEHKTEMDIEIYNVHGQLISEFRKDLGASNIDLSHLRSGVYTMKFKALVNQIQIIQAKKLIIQE